MPDQGLQSNIAAMRRFNRFYTQRIGVLREGWAKSAFSLTEARVLYEVIHRGATSASALGKDLGLDAGYLSRILRSFRAQGLIGTRTAPKDRRQKLLSPTPRGRKAFAPLEARTQREVAAMLNGVPNAEQARLIAAMRSIEGVLGTPVGDAPVALRPPRPGDMGWVVSRHGALYGRDYGWDARLEALTAEIVARFIRNVDATCERCWIAERDGENLGCVFLVKETKRVARLRLLLVEPKARGLGLGTRLVEECIAFARAAGYRKITLWTHSVLSAARKIYQAQGFKLVATQSHEEFGKTVQGETWDLQL
jgi:DNA-binding MarR family transcriptional regulator/N-acetylglutamate synthase-like GNAT family acetyltransferase